MKQQKFKSLKFNTLFVCFILIFSLVPNYARAATDGCPSTWKIDTSSANGINELLQAKQKLQNNMAIDDGVLVYSNFSGELGPMKAPSVLKFSQSDYVLYGKTTVQKKFTVQVKDCPGITEFVFNLGTLAASNLTLDVNPKIWADQNQNFFIDFTKAEQFSRCISNLQNQVASPGNYNVEKRGNKLNFVLVNLLRPGTQYCGLFNNSFLTLMNFDESCRWVNRDVLPLWMGVTMNIGGKCAVAFSVGSTVFEKFVIDANNWKTSIVCFKGKQRKIISGIKGYEFELKCPVGFSKK